MGIECRAESLLEDRERDRAVQDEFEQIEAVSIEGDDVCATVAGWIGTHGGRLPSNLLAMGPTHADAELAQAIAADVGRALTSLREAAGAAISSDAPFDDAALRRSGDAAAQSIIQAALTAARPADAVLSEEAADDVRRLGAERVWIVDPLDGTREFGERDAAGSWRDDFAVHIALWERGRGLTLGVVALPARGEIYRSDAAAAVPTRSAGVLRLAVSRTRPPEFIVALERQGSAQLVPMGSAGVKAMAVVSGQVDAYIHAGGQYQWDSAAPVAVALAAGLVATRLDGSPLAYNVPELLLPDLLICRPDRVDEVRELLDAAGVGPHRTSGTSTAESGE